MATNANPMTCIAGLLNSIAWMDQESAREVLPLADAALDALTVMIYQAGTGRATRRQFSDARKELRRVLDNADEFQPQRSML